MAANVPEPTRVLSIQSHVVSGYVGNRSATFPLQLLGWEVDVVNTVQFSNHTGFGRWGGTALDAQHLSDVFTGLDENGLLRYARVLTGYCPGPEALQTVHKLIDRLRELNPELLYVLDPVMGDMDRGMYVDPSVLPIYKSMLPLASIITPNQFEAQALAGTKITSLTTLHETLNTLHTTYGVLHVLITSVELPESDLKGIGMSNYASDGSKLMTLVGSSKHAPSPEQADTIPSSEVLRPWCIQFPEVEGYFSGVGDLFAALVLGRYKRPEEAQFVSNSVQPSPVPSAVGTPRTGTPIRETEAPLSRSALLDQLHSAPTPLSRAVELAIASLQSILATTSAYIERHPPIPTKDQWDAWKNSGDVRVPPAPQVAHQHGSADPWDAQAEVELFRRRELKVVQSRSGIEEPQVLHRARWLQPAHEA